MTAISQQLFIAVRGFLVLLGREDEGELVLYDPGIRAPLRSFGESNKFGKNKIAFSADTENMVTQSVTKSVLCYFNVHSKDASFKNGSQEKLDCLTFNKNGSLCLAGSLNGNLFIWSSFTGEMLAKLKVSIGAVRKVHVDREDSRVLLLTSDNKLVTYDLGRHSVDRDLIKHLIARGQLDAANLKPLISVSPHKKAILDMVIPEGEETIAMTLSQDNTVKVTDLLTGNQLADIFLEDVPSCFCSDFLGTSVFVGFVDGKIRKYNYLQNAVDLTLEAEKDTSGAIIPKLEPQEAKVLLDARHKGRVTSIIYVPEMKELISSGGDDMLFMFTTSGVTTFSTGKFKCAFDFMQLVQRPASLYLSSHFGTNTIKSKMLVKPFSKTTIDHIAGDPLVRTFVPLKKNTDNSEEESLISKKETKRAASSLLDTFEECLQGKVLTTSGNGKAPMLKKREIEELEAENSQLKQRLLTLANMNKQLLKKVKTEQEE